MFTSDNQKIISNVNQSKQHLLRKKTRKQKQNKVYLYNSFDENLQENKKLQKRQFISKLEKDKPDNQQENQDPFQQKGKTILQQQSQPFHQKPSKSFQDMSEKPSLHQSINRSTFNFISQQQLVQQAERIIQQANLSKAMTSGGKIKKVRRCSQINEDKLNHIVVTFRLYKKSLQNKGKRKQRMSLKRLSKYLKINKKKVYSLYDEFQYDSQMTNQRMRISINKHKRGCDPKTRLRIEAIKKILQQNPFFTQGQIANILNEDPKFKRHGQLITIRHISRILQLMNYSKKKIVKIPKGRNTPTNIQIRFRYCKQYLEWVSQGKKVYFLDESAFNVFSMRNAAWSARGQPIEQKVNSGSQNLSLCAIISQQGVVHYQVKKGNFKNFHYIGFLQEFVKKLIQSGQKQKVYLVMDNCRIHDDDASKLLAQKSNILQIKKLPPYSPSLNPIQNWFHMLKSRVRRRNYTTQKQLRNEVENIIESQFTKCDFSNFYRHTNTHAERGLQRKNF